MPVSANSTTMALSRLSRMSLPVAAFEQTLQLVVDTMRDGLLVLPGWLHRQHAGGVEALLGLKPAGEPLDRRQPGQCGGRWNGRPGWPGTRSRWPWSAPAGSPSWSRNRRNSATPALVGPQGGGSLAFGLERDHPGGQQIIERGSTRMSARTATSRCSPGSRPPCHSPIGCLPATAWPHCRTCSRRYAVRDTPAMFLPRNRFHHFANPLPPVSAQ